MGVNRVFAILMLLSVSCTGKPIRKINPAPSREFNTDSSVFARLYEVIPYAVSRKLTPVFGYRFIISGDFNGDGKQERLIEHYVDGYVLKESPKYYDNVRDYEQLVDLSILKNPRSYALSDNLQLDTLSIYSGGQLLGLSYLKNEGDLNADGTDEVSYVVQYADWSSMNTWHIVTYRDNRWQEIFAFDIWDWQLPDLPETFNQYGLFGLEDKVINTKDTAINKKTEQQLQDFKGLVVKVAPHKIRITYMNEEAEEATKTVDLRTVKKTQDGDFETYSVK